MSIITNISSLPDTKQTFEPFQNTYSQICGIFVTEKDYEFSSVEDFQDIDKWYEALKDGDIIPLHYAKTFSPANEEQQYKESQQDFSFGLRPGRIKNKLGYVWTIDVHTTVDTLSGTDKYVFYWDKNKNIYGTSDNGVSVRGFSTNRITLEKPSFANGVEPAFSPLEIELKDSREYSSRGVVKEMAWEPSKVDRLFANITIDYTDEDNLNFTAKYLGTPITDITSSDISIIDNYLGEPSSFTLSNIGGGAYQTTNFTPIPFKLKNGLLKIVSDLYIACVPYKITITVIVINNYVFEDGNNFVLEDGNNFIYDN